jgi:glyoxylase-like metal-dependent hydrolase (beta-lactamase superfamily II)
MPAWLLTARCLHRHTMGHICYFVEDGQDERAVFTGDTLVSLPCLPPLAPTRASATHHSSAALVAVSS